jgi:hypothetical protein
MSGFFNLTFWKRLFYLFGSGLSGLGHISIQTTEVYARADSKQKRESLEAAYVNIIPVSADECSWEKDSKLKTWLKGLGK